MIPKECKRLAEVDFPIAEVSRHSAREKSIRHGHPSTLHLWWARRPLAACRAMLMALLLPDPVEDLCPGDFKIKALELLPELVGTIKKDDLALRKALLKFIADFANWDNSAHPIYLKVARGLVKAAHPEETPLVVDPFAGGGSIPLEALRVGCEASASDLNPVACLILKVVLEDIPRHGLELAEELRRVGDELKKKAEKELAEFYPTDPDGATPIAYLWARTVKCESPNCGAEIPLLRSFWLCNRAGRKLALKYRVVQLENAPPDLEFELFTPKSDSEVPRGSVTRAKAICLSCGSVMSPAIVRSQLSKQKGGTEVIFDKFGARVGGSRLMAVVSINSNTIGRHYRIPYLSDYEVVNNAQEKLNNLIAEWENNGMKGHCPVPNESIQRVPVPFGVINVWVYGVNQWRHLFSSRQALTLATFAKYIKSRADTKARPSIVLSKMSDLENAFCAWRASSECIDHLFSRQAIPMIWDFAEASPFAGATGSWDSMLSRSINGLISAQTYGAIGQVTMANAASHPMPSQSADIWFTDPPYYDAVPYSYVSDFFYVWLKRMESDSIPNWFSTELTRKEDEIVAYDVENNVDTTAKRRYENLMAKAFREGKRIVANHGIASIVFAHKTTEGWEALLNGMVDAGLIVTASWPIATEMKSRLRARDSATLATSVHLVCRPRPKDAATGDWGEVLMELPKRVGRWIERLQGEGIRGADLVFACIGPALEIFSRYSKVETADGSEVKLDVYLEKVWEVVGRIALENVLGTDEAQARNGMAGALEEDARLTALFLWTLQSTETDVTKDTNGAGEDDIDENTEEEDDAPKSKSKGFSLVFDVARRFAQPLGIHLDTWEGRIIETKKGVVRLLAVTERAKMLFGEAGASAVAHELEMDPAKAAQFELALGVAEAAPKIKTRGRRKKAPVDVTDKDFSTEQQATTLDRVHASMLLQKAGRTNALRALLKAEQQRSPDFLRLANALSALYPKNSEEKRLLDAMLLAVPR